MNSLLVGFFDSSCYLRQGDLLSLLLFIIIMEILSKMILGLVEDGFLYSFSMENNDYGSINIFHLLFANDTLNFCRATNLGHF